MFISDVIDGIRERWGKKKAHTAGGGYFTSKPFTIGDEDPRQIQRASAILWGCLTGDPEDRAGERSRRVTFYVKYGTKKYIKCVSWNPFITEVMANCEDGDVVFCLGRFKRERIETKKGKVWSWYVDCDLVLPMLYVWFMSQLFGSRFVNDGLEADANAPPDVWEGDRDRDTGV